MRHLPHPRQTVKVYWPRFRIQFDAEVREWFVTNDVFPLSQCPKCREWLTIRQIVPHVIDAHVL